ncbi:MAG: 2-hydroxyglutaryl-CoA dehydratase [Oscillospiraceae bacterium]
MQNEKQTNDDRILFTKKMRKEYTILIPMMAPIHFNLIKNVFIDSGYKMELLTNAGPSVVEEGLKYVHNDTCYPALLVIGQMIDALNSGKYDVNKTALMITQTGGGCRASNYIHLLRKALKKAGYEYVPVISLNLSGLEKSSGFKLTLPMVRKSLATLAYGDLLMLLNNQVKPYEVCKGESERVVSDWIENLSAIFAKGKGLSVKEMTHIFSEIVTSFTDIMVVKIDKVKVGIVGEIYVKYSSLANNNLEDFLFEQGCEVMVPGLISFMLFKIDNRLEDINLYGGSKIKHFIINLFMKYLCKVEQLVIEAVQSKSDFIPPSPYPHVKSLVRDIIGYGNKMGEGWLLTAEMVELTEQRYLNIVCTQPFGCLPNHIVGKGMIHKIKELYPNSNIVPIDYDPGATKVNQENRLKLMLAVASEKISTKERTPSVEKELVCQS